MTRKGESPSADIMSPGAFSFLLLSRVDRISCWDVSVAVVFDSDGMEDPSTTLHTPLTRQTALIRRRQRR